MQEIKIIMDAKFLVDMAELGVIAVVGWSLMNVVDTILCEVSGARRLKRGKR